MWKKLKEFFQEVKVEFKKVSWPSRSETIDSTKVVIIVVLVIAFYLGIVDVVLSNGVKRILNSAPKASFNVTTETGDTNTSFIFDAGNSYDKEDDASLLMVRWDFDNDGIWDFPGSGYAKGKTTTHRFSKQGVYTVKLNVKDSFGANETILRKITVQKAKEPVNPTATENTVK